MSLTDRLIHRLEQAEHPDRLHLLCLDKSGRPVAWLLKAFWPLLARTPGTVFADGVVPPMPTISFANIDREQWWDVTGGSETGIINVNNVPSEDAVQLRLAYLRNEPGPGLTIEEAYEAPTWVDDRDILVIDEVRASGDTLTIAGGLVRRAFPANTVETAHWMAPEVRTNPKSGVRQQIVNPVWYRSDTSLGRLIGNRMAPDHRGKSWRGSVAPLFMSTVPSERDQAGLQLRREIQDMADEVAAGTLLAAPAATRDIDDAVDRIRHIYGYEDPRAFSAARAAQNEQ